MDVFDKASQGGGKEVVTTANLPDADPARIVTPDLYPADDLTPDGEFPEFGEFLEMRRESDGETVFWECSTALAEVLAEEFERAEEQEPTGTRVDVEFVAKAPSGEWRLTLDVEPETTLMDAEADAEG